MREKNRKMIKGNYQKGKITRNNKRKELNKIDYHRI